MRLLDIVFGPQPLDMIPSHLKATVAYKAPPRLRVVLQDPQPKRGRGAYHVGRSAGEATAGLSTSGRLPEDAAREEGLVEAAAGPDPANIAASDRPMTAGQGSITKRLLKFVLPGLAIPLADPL